jgi:hypothetical protein
MNLMEKHLPGNRIAHVFPLTFGRARIGVGQADSQCYDSVY